MWEKLITNYFQHCFVEDHPLDLLLGEGRKDPLLIERTPYCGGCSTSDSRSSQIFAPNWNVLKTWEPATVWARTLTLFALSPSYNCCCRSHNSTKSPLLLWTLHLGDSEPAPTSAQSTGCPLLLSCAWTSTELIFGFSLLTNSVGNTSLI
jgi:hypothetical protein